MAITGPIRGRLPDTLREFFECSACGRRDEYMEDPVVLPCLHSICLGCLYTRVKMSLCKEEVECPTCTQRATIPPGGLKAFLTSERFSRVAFKTLCDPKFMYLPGGPNPRCGLHPREEVSHYCHRCHVQVCGKCVTSYHEEHEAEVEDVGAAANKMDQELVSLLDSSTQEVEESISTITDNQRSIQCGFDEVSKQIKDRAQQLMEEVKKWEEHNLQKLQDITQQQDRSLQEALEKSEAQRSRLQKYKQYVDILHERGKDSEKTARCRGLRALVEKQRNPQPKDGGWHSQMVQHEDPGQRETLAKIRRSICSYLAVVGGPKHKHTISIPCKGALGMRFVTLLGQQQLLHCFLGDTAPENKNKICIHNTDGRVNRVLTIPEMEGAYSLAAVDPPGGKLIVADLNQENHQSGCLHWITLSETYDIVKHEITQLQCGPYGYMNVDGSGQVLVTTRCTSRKHPNRLVIYDKDRHRELQVIDLPGMLGWPASAVNSAPGVFTVLYHGSSKAVWLDSKGKVLRTYGDRPEEVISQPHHVLGSAEGYLVISDHYNHRLHLLNRNGAFLQYLLCKERDHIESPSAISLDEQAGLLAVSCDDKSMKVFSLIL